MATPIDGGSPVPLSPCFGASRPRQSPVKSACPARRPPDPAPDALIFRSPKGLPIDDHTFSQKVWKSLCAAAGVPYRPPYACRHTLSHLMEAGATVFQAAYVAGHKSPRMVIERYGHMVNRPEMPDF